MVILSFNGEKLHEHELHWILQTNCTRYKVSVGRDKVSVYKVSVQTFCTQTLCHDPQTLRHTDTLSHPKISTDSLATDTLYYSPSDRPLY